MCHVILCEKISQRPQLDYLIIIISTECFEWTLPPCYPFHNIFSSAPLIHYFLWDGPATIINESVSETGRHLGEVSMVEAILILSHDTPCWYIYLCCNKIFTAVKKLLTWCILYYSTLRFCCSSLKMKMSVATFFCVTDHAIHLRLSIMAVAVLSTCPLLPSDVWYSS